MTICAIEVTLPKPSPPVSAKLIGTSDVKCWSLIRRLDKPRIYSSANTADASFPPGTHQAYMRYGKRWTARSMDCDAMPLSVTFSRNAPTLQARAQSE